MYRSLLILALTLMVCATTACGSKKKDPGVTKDDPKDYTLVAGTGAVTVNDDRDFTEPRVYDRSNLGIHALGNGRFLVLSARNKSDLEMRIQPRNLALIVGPDPKKDLIQITPLSADLKKVPPLILNPGERGVMRIPMREIGDLRGTRLVYNNPELNILFFVQVD